MPVEEVTVEWPERLSPFVTVAKLRLPRQDISGDVNLAKMDALSFTPWRVTAEHRPLGNIMRVRKLNQQERSEPHSADELLAVKLGADRSWRRPADPATSGS